LVTVTAQRRLKSPQPNVHPVNYRSNGMHPGISGTIWLDAEDPLFMLYTR